jgi:hypothetical protein
LEPVRRLAARAALLSAALLALVITGCPLAANTSLWGDPTASRSWSFLGSPAFSGGSYTTSIGFDAGGNVFVALQENNSSLYTGRVMWNPGGAGTTWLDLGSPTLAGTRADSIRLAISQGGGVFVTYCVGLPGAVNVLTFDGTNWVNVGSTVATSGHSPALAFDQAGNLYVAFADDSNAGQLTVEKWTGSAWSVVGGGAVSPATVDSVSIGIDSSGRIFVSYEDNSYGNQGSAFVWDGATWSRLGPQGFTGTTVANISLAMDLYGNPWVAYMDAGVGERATVMEYRGGAWEQVGNRGFTAGWADSLQMVISPSGTPYVGYADQSLGDAACVMVLRGTTWDAVGKSGLSPGATAFESVAAGSNGTVAVAFQDRANGYATTVMAIH